MPQRRVQELNITPQMRFISYTNLKRSLKIPQAQSEFVYRRRTDNTMVKRKRKKGQPTIYKTYIYKTKDRITRTPLKTGFELRCSGCSLQDILAFIFNKYQQNKSIYSLSFLPLKDLPKQNK